MIDHRARSVPPKGRPLLRQISTCVSLSVRTADVGVWRQRQHEDAIGFLREENRMPKVRFGGRRLRVGEQERPGEARRSRRRRPRLGRGKARVVEHLALGSLIGILEDSHLPPRSCEQSVNNVAPNTTEHQLLTRAKATKNRESRHLRYAVNRRVAGSNPARGAKSDASRVRPIDRGF